MTVMKNSWKDLQKLPISSGEDFRNFRKKKELKAEFLIWKQRLFQDLQLTALVILMNP